MRRFLKDFMLEHNSISALKKTQGFYFFKIKTTIDLLILVTIYLSLSYGFIQISNITNVLSFVYYDVILGAVLITYVLTVQRELEFQKKSQTTYNIYNSVIINIQHILFILTMLFSIQIIFHYLNKLTVFDLIFHSLLLLILIGFKVVKYYTKQKEFHTGLYVDFFEESPYKTTIIIIVGLISFNILASLISYVSIGMELFIITCGLVIIYIINIIFSLLSKFKVRWYFIALILLLITGSVLFRDRSIISQFNSNGYLHLEKTYFKNENLKTIIELNGITYVHYNSTKQAYTDTIVLYNSKNKVILEHSVKHLAHLFEQDGKVYLSLTQQSSYNELGAVDQLYEVTANGLILLLENDVKFHTTIPFWLDGKYTYIVSKYEAYQIIDGDSKELKEIYRLGNERKELLNTNELKIFYENGHYYYSNPITEEQDVLVNKSIELISKSDIHPDFHFITDNNNDIYIQFYNDDNSYETYLVDIYDGNDIFGGILNSLNLYLLLAATMFIGPVIIKRKQS